MDNVYLYLYSIIIAFFVQSKQLPTKQTFTQKANDYPTKQTFTYTAVNCNPWKQEKPVQVIAPGQVALCYEMP